MAANGNFGVHCFLFHRQPRPPQITFCSLMAGLVSDRHLIQAIHQPASETLTHDGSGFSVEVAGDLDAVRRAVLARIPLNRPAGSARSRRGGDW